MNRSRKTPTLLLAAGLSCLFPWSAPARAGDSRPADGAPAAPAPPAASEARDANKVTEITLERTICYGGCPVYKVVIRPDGSFTYEGILHVQRKGQHTGKLPEGRFQQLADEAIHIGYGDLQDSYFRPIHDLPSANTSVTIDGKRKDVRDQRDAGPGKLVTFERMIDDALADAKWDEPKASQEKESKEAKDSKETRSKEKDAAGR